MTDNPNAPATYGAAAMEMLRTARAETDEALKKLKELPASDGIRLATIDAAVVEAHSNRELAAAVIVATEIVDSSIQTLNHQIVDFTKKADKGTKRLVVATWALAIAAIVAALIGAYATLTVAPQIITVAKP